MKLPEAGVTWNNACMLTCNGENKQYNFLLIFVWTAALVKVNGGIEKGQWRHWSGSMQALVRVDGGIEKGQWAMGVLNNGGSIRVLKKINGGGALVRVNAGIEKGQWGGGIGQGQWGY